MPSPRCPSPKRCNEAICSGACEQQNSEVARLLAQINNEYEAAERGLSGLAQGMSQHRFMTKRTERIAEYHEQLRSLVGDEAMALIDEELSPKISRHGRAARIEHLAETDEGFQQWLQAGIDDIEAKRTVTIAIEDQEELDPELLAAIARKLRETREYAVDPQLKGDFARNYGRE